jgi:sigma-B regulation protein RsbU (phosphoserine phosphatase)
VGVPGMLLFGGVIWLVSDRSFDRVRDQTEQLIRAMVETHAARLDGTLFRASKIPELLAGALESGTVQEEAQLETLLGQMVQKSPEFYGSCVAFEPESFKAGERLYAPYFYWKDGEVKFEQLGTPSYDYFKWDWYESPKAAGRALWSEPYFDEGGGNALMITYSVPFRKAEAFWGIATIDIALSQFAEELSRIRVGTTGYAFLVNRTGKFIVHPDPQSALKTRIQDINPELARHLLASEQGVMRTRDPFRDADSWIAYAPIQNGSLALALVYPREEVLLPALKLQREMFVLGGVGLLALFGAIFLVARSISKPIAQLSIAAQEVAAGNLNQRLDIVAGSEEVRNLANSFRKMTRDLKMRMQELEYTTTVQQRLEGELSAARTIQMSLLPKRFPAFPDRQEIDLHAIVKPARAVGGDFYDYYFIDADTMCLVIADVAGKGVAAALFMAVTKTLLKANSVQAMDPAEMLTRVNDELNDESTGMFVSLLFAVLNVRTGELRFCNAGHPAPFLISATGERQSLNGNSGVALGAWRHLRYEVHTHQLREGDTLLLFTDGVTEALNPQEQFYSIDRLEDLAGRFSGQSAQQMTNAVANDVRDFCAEHEQNDDLTILAARWLGQSTPRETSQNHHAT